MFRSMLHRLFMNNPQLLQQLQGMGGRRLPPGMTPPFNPSEPISSTPGYGVGPSRPIEKVGRITGPPLSPSEPRYDHMPIAPQPHPGITMPGNRIGNPSDPTPYPGKGELSGWLDKHREMNTRPSLFQRKIDM